MTKARNKAFLNDNHEEFGYVAWYVKPYKCSLTGEEDGDYYSHVTIADCSQTITLDFNFENKHQLYKRIKKLDTLIDELMKMRLVLDECKDKFKPKKFYY